MRLQMITLMTAASVLLAGCMATAFGGSPPTKSKRTKQSAATPWQLPAQQPSSVAISRLPLVAIRINPTIQG